MLDNRAYEENSGVWRWLYYIKEDALGLSDILSPCCVTLSFFMGSKLFLIYVNSRCTTSVTIHETTSYSCLQCTANRELFHFAPESLSKHFFQDLLKVFLFGKNYQDSHSFFGSMETYFLHFTHFHKQYIIVWNIEDTYLFINFSVFAFV